MKISKKESNGTSFHGHTIKATKAQLMAIIGAPQYVNPPLEKCQNDWILENEHGRVFTIYDWKEYRAFGDDEVISWHIGAHRFTDSHIGHQEIQQALVAV